MEFPGVGKNLGYIMIDSIEKKFFHPSSSRSSNLSEAEGSMDWKKKILMIGISLSLSDSAFDLKIARIRNSEYWRENGYLYYFSF